MKKLITILIIAASVNLTAQVGIGTNNPDSAAMLEAASNEKGFLPPRMTTAQRDAINGGNPSAGLVIYNLDVHCLEFFNATEWVSFCDLTQINYRIGGSSQDYPLSMKKTVDGGLIVAGYSSSTLSGDITSVNNGGVDSWVIKIGASGNIEWSKLYGGSGEDRAHDVEQTADGGYIVVGLSNSSASGDVTGTNNGGYDVWMLKLDSLGNIEWQKLYGGSGGERASAVRQTSDGGYIIGANSTSSVSGDVSGTITGNSDMWIIKTDGLGIIQWENLYGEFSQYNETNYIYQNQDGSYTIGAERAGFYVLNINAVGTKQWERTYRGDFGDQFFSMRETADGGYILIGNTSASASGDVTDVSNGSRDLWVIKLDSTGNKQWDKLYGGTGGETGLNIQQTKDGGYIISSYASTSIGTGDIPGPGKGGNDVWIVRLDNSGNMLWNKIYGGMGYEEGNYVQELPTGGYVIAASSDSISAGNGDQTNLVSRGGRDLWLFYIDEDGNITEP